MVATAIHLSFSSVSRVAGPRLQSMETRGPLQMERKSTIADWQSRGEGGVKLERKKFIGGALPRLLSSFFNFLSNLPALPSSFQWSMLATVVVIIIIIMISSVVVLLKWGCKAIYYFSSWRSFFQPSSWWQHQSVSWLVGCMDWWINRLVGRVDWWEHLLIVSERWQF